MIAKALGIVVAVLLLALAGAGAMIKYQADSLVSAKAETQRYRDQEKRNLTAYATAMDQAQKFATEQEIAHAKEMSRIAAAHNADIKKAKARRDRDVADARNGAIKLLVSADSCKARGSSAAEVGTAPARGDGPATIELPKPVTEFLLGLANDADETADALRSAQAVITACYAAQNPNRVPAP